MGHGDRHESKSSGVGCLLLLPGFFIGLDALTDMTAAAPQSLRLFAEILGWFALYIVAAHSLGRFLFRGVRRKRHDMVALAVAIATAMTLLPVVIASSWLVAPVRQVISVILQLIGVAALLGLLVALVLYLRAAVDPKRDRRKLRRSLEKLGILKRRSRRHH